MSADQIPALPGRKRCQTHIEPVEDRIPSNNFKAITSDNPSLTINTFPIEQVSSTKSLGVSIDENLSWNTHIETLCKKISSALSLIKRI